MTVLVADTDFALHLGDVLDVLPTLTPESVDAVVMSPPYADARDDVGWYSDLTYADWCYRWLERLLVVTRPDGSLMLNLGRLHRDGQELDYWVDVLGRARRAGWYWLDTLVWHKVNGGGGKGSPYLIDRHEYVFWLARSVTPYKGFDEARQPYSPATLERYTRKWKAGSGAVKGKDSAEQHGRDLHPAGAKPGTVFTSSAGATKGVAHPTPMDADLAEHLVKLSCPPGGIVLDPFAGSGTTALAARKLGRRSINIEIDAAHASEAARRLAQQTIFSGDGA